MEKESNIICLQSPAFYALLDEVIARLNEKFSLPLSQKWIDGNTAMLLLNIKSKTTLQELRNEGKLRFSQPQHKIILYDRDSIMHYIEQHAHETF